MSPSEPPYQSYLGISPLRPPSYSGVLGVALFADERRGPRLPDMVGFRASVAEEAARCGRVARSRPRRHTGLDMAQSSCEAKFYCATVTDRIAGHDATSRRFVYQVDARFRPNLLRSEKL